MDIKKNELKICTKCVMDTTDPHISFDENGVCDFCRDYEKNILKNWKPNFYDEKGLMNISNKIKKKCKNKKYDCIIGLSGGVDSSYLCYVAKEIMGLRPFVYISNTGWNLPVADSNIKKVIEKLNLDYYVEEINWEEMKDLQVAFLKSQVPYQDLVQDHVIFAGLYNYAVKHGFKYVLTGANIATESIRPPMEWVYMNDVRMIKDIHKKYGKVDLKSLPMCGMLKYKIWYKYFKGMHRVAPLDYVIYNKTDIEKFLKEYYGWEPYANKHYEDIFTRWYEGYYLPQKFGYDKRKCYFSNLIHINEMTREEALKKLAERPYDSKTIESDTKYIAEKLGLSSNELKEIIKGPNKTFRDYKNQYGLIKFGIKVSRFFGIENRNFR